MIKRATLAAAIAVAAAGAAHAQHADPHDFVLRPPKQEEHFGFHLLGGGGFSFRDVEIAQFAGVGVAPYCDPYLLACYATPIAVSQVIGSRDSFDFGLDAGLGAYAMLSPPLRLYLEARYHDLWGPEFEGPNGDRVDSDGQYLPVVLGLAL